MFLLINLLHLLILMSACANKSPEPKKPILRIINGWEGKVGDAPYQVAFKKPMGNVELATFCGGSIISADVVLSAAHCFVEDPGFWQRLLHLERTLKPLSKVYAVAGTIGNTNIKPRHSSARDGQWRTIRTVHCQRSYDFPTNDICIVFLSEAFIFNEYVNSIPFATQNADYTGTCLASGFGMLASDKKLSLIPDKLMLAHVSLVRSAECSSNLKYDTCKFVCTSTEPMSTAPGDSGGPLVCQIASDPKGNSTHGILVGVTCGSLFSKTHTYRVFTRISVFKDYIHSDIMSMNNHIDSEITTVLYRIRIIVFLLLLTLFLF